MACALVLFSGGLDSILTVKLLKQLGVEVKALYFDNPFVALNQEGEKKKVAKRAAELGVPLYVEPLGEDYLKLIAAPRFGYGKNYNPCLDCRIYLLRRAKELLKTYGADFLATGEVLGERPMSQRRDALALIDREAGVKGLVLRPLSAKLLPPTLAEEKGWVDREKLLDIRGRSRKPQLALAESWGIKDFPTPAGGCLLTSPEFAKKVRDFLAAGKELSLAELPRLKVGRHFRISPQVKAIVGRNRQENEYLAKLAGEDDLLFKVKGFRGPLALAPVSASPAERELIARLTARYSDAPRGGKVAVACFPAKGGQEAGQILEVFPLSEEEVEKYRIR